MKKVLLKFLSILVVGCLLFSCDPSTGKNSGDNNQQQQHESLGKNIKGNIDVKFDFSGAQALAKLDSKKEGARAVTNADDLGELVKILANGSMEDAITIGENCYLSDIVAIYKSPLETSKDIFIVFKGESTIGYAGDESIRVGQLICLHEDESITDILKKDDVSNSWNSHMSLNTESVTFDAAGNLYFISTDNGDMIYQYNPQADELTKMVAAVENTEYEKMQIDDEGQWIFVSGARSGSPYSYFLRAIPISNPDSFKNIYYSSNQRIYEDKWVYDNKNEVMYFLALSGTQKGLFRSAKKDGFKNIEFLGSNTSIGDENYTSESFFNSFYSYSKDTYWDSFLDENGEFSASKAVDELCSRSFHVNGYEKATKEYISFKKLTREDLDIRFDKFEKEEGQLQVIYLLTKGKKNEEALAALDCWAGRKALDSLGSIDYFSGDNGKGYKHNFFADTLYIKDTDILLSDSTDVILTYYQTSEPAVDEEGHQIINNVTHECEKIYSDEKELTGKDFFSKKANSNYEFNEVLVYCRYTDSEVYPDVVGYSFTKDYSELLDYFFSFCNVQGDKEFRLTAYKDDSQYSCLYSDLTDEAALEWLSSDIERLSLFGKALHAYYSEKYIDNKIVPGFWIDYEPLISFIAKTCFIKETDNKAVTENREQMLCIPYAYNNSEFFWDSYGSGNLSVSDEGVFYQFSNLYDNWYSSSSSKPYYFIVQIADSDGVFVENVNEIVLPMGKVVSSLKSDNRIFMQYSLLNETGGELGYHHIYSVDLSTSEVINHFENVPNPKSLEVITFNVAGSNLYFSAVRGTTVENMIVNLLTNEYNPLTVQRKMVAVYTFN